MKVLVFPKDKNPYQQLLYQDMKNVQISYLSQDIDSNLLSGLIKIPFELINKRVHGYKIFHLHWLNKFYTHTFNSTYTRFFFFLYIIFFILEIKLLRYKLVWTVHNVLPHEKQTINDGIILRLLCKFADAKIIHSKYTISELRQLHANTENTTIIPIGNYIQCYENKISREEARKRLSIKQDMFVYSYFGLIRKYKGIEKLLNTFIKVKQQNINVVLIISGKCDEKSILKTINDIQNKYNECIHTFIKYIPDNEVQIYFNAADIMVFPFDKITTSSSVLLSASFGKALIYPQIGNLKELPNNIGFSYQINENNGLQKAMLLSIQQRHNLDLLNKNSFLYAKSLSWEAVADKTHNLYNLLIKS